MVKVVFSPTLLGWNIVLNLQYHKTAKICGFERPTRKKKKIQAHVLGQESERTWRPSGLRPLCGRGGPAKEKLSAAYFLLTFKLRSCSHGSQICLYFEHWNKWYQRAVSLNIGSKRNRSCDREQTLFFASTHFWFHPTPLPSQTSNSQQRQKTKKMRYYHQHSKRKSRSAHIFDKVEEEEVKKWHREQPWIYTRLNVKRHFFFSGR